MGSIAIDALMTESHTPDVKIHPSKAAAQSQAQTNGTKTPYKIKEAPIGSHRPTRIICMGAGYSGLMMGIVYTQQMRDNNTEFVIYERNNDLGGTWLENRYAHPNHTGILLYYQDRLTHIRCRYPGCSCDIPAHNYAYSFAPNPGWPNYYATSEQIHAYMKDTAHKYDVEKYTKYNHSIVDARWNDQAGKWNLKVRDAAGKTFDDQCDVFVNAAGVLNKWKWPSIDGLQDFEGKLLHSASWDQSYDFTDKRVGVIGIGSSGIQIVPKLAKVAKSLTSFIRSQTWISPSPGVNEPTANDPEMDKDYNFSPDVLQKFEEDPEYLLDHRRAIINRRIDNFKRAMKDSDVQVKAQALFTKSMSDRLGDSERGKKLREMLVPKFPVGCRRQTPGPGFLEVLLQDNVQTRWDDILKITKKGILTKSGDELEFDAIVCATGFDTSFQPSFPIVGKNGANLAQQWTEDRPKAYFGITVPNFPNYFSKSIWTCTNHRDID